VNFLEHSRLTFLIKRGVEILIAAQTDRKMRKLHCQKEKTRACVRLPFAAALLSLCGARWLTNYLLHAAAAH
jgi:hypothetical protein